MTETHTVTEATMTPTQDVISVDANREIPLEVELANLPFTYDKDAKNDFLKVSREKLALMSAQGWEFLTTDRAINYRKNWDTWFGIREFVQNSLDEAGSVEITYDAATNITYIKDDGKGFMAKHLLLGQHKGMSEEERHTTRGCFGEGMKLAALPFFRAGCKVFIRTVGLDIAFAMGPFDEHYVHYTFKRKNNHTRGTHIAISNFDGGAFKERFTPFIPKGHLVKSVKGGHRKFDKDKVRSVYDRPGDIYVRDIFVQNVNKSYERAYFGYNFWFDHNEGVLDPDRSTIKNHDYLSGEFEYLLGCKDVEFLTKFFSRISTPDKALSIVEPRYSWEHRHIHGNNLTLDEDQAKAIFKALQNVFGKKEFTWTSDYAEEKALEHLGILNLNHKIPNLVQPLRTWKLIKTAQEWVMLGDLKHTCEVTERMVADVHGEDAGKALTTTQKILTDIAKSYSSYNSEVVFFWSIKPSREVDRVGGFYTHSKRKISIKINQLRAFHDTMQCFIHELGHAISNGAEDLSEKFEKGMMEAGFNVVEYFQRHENSYRDLKSAIDTLSDFQWTNFKIDLSGAEMTVGDKTIEQVRQELAEKAEAERKAREDAGKNFSSSISSMAKPTPIVNGKRNGL